MKREAFFSEDRRFRYSLSRIWDESGKLVLFVCLNPSNADETKDDPTVAKCIKLAEMWGFGGIIIGNLFAVKSTDPDKIYRVADPIGPDNDKWLQRLSAQASLTVVAWGNDGSFMNRGKGVLRMLEDPHALKVNKIGEPSHPLYLPINTRPKPYKGKKLR